MEEMIGVSSSNVAFDRCKRVKEMQRWKSFDADSNRDRDGGGGKARHLGLHSQRRKDRGETFAGKMMASGAPSDSGLKVSKTR